MSAESILQRLEEIKTKLNELPREVAKEGMNEANRNFGNMTKATETLDGRGFKIQGTQAMIAEFGAGTMTQSTHPFASDADVGVPVYPGSYSERHAKQFSTRGEWEFGGKPYTFVQPRMGMYYGMKYMKQNLNSIAERVFNK